jgi:aromatic ring-opening dioxygenase catalytic subunit (LigB family)
MSDTKRMPVVFIPHGGGPWPFVDLGFDREECDELAAYLRGLAEVPPVPPRAVLVISAHWEESVPTVMTGERPPLLYDYYNFPAAAYAIEWPAPGSPEVAARVQELLGAAGIASATNAERGFDHGTFVPLKLTYPAGGRADGAAVAAQGARARRSTSRSGGRSRRCATRGCSSSAAG